MLTYRAQVTIGCASDESWPAPFKGSPGGASPFATNAWIKIFEELSKNAEALIWIKNILFQM